MMQNKSGINITISVQRPLQHKQIDTRWTQIKIAKPFVTRSSSASTIQAGDIYVHGGCNRQTGILSDFYTAKMHDLPTKWILLPQKGVNPGPLRNHTLTPYLSFIILIGGQKNMMESNNKIYAYDLRNCQWKQCQVIYINEKGQEDKNKKQKFPSLDSHTIVHQGSIAYIMFGYDSQLANFSKKIIKLDLKEVSQNKVKWQQVKVNINNKQKLPALRTCSAAVWFKDQIFVFGGGGQYGTLDDMWIFKTLTKTWQRILQPEQQNKFWPSKRKGHSLVFHANSGNIFMFGGLKEITKQQNDVCIFLRQRKKWAQIHTNTNDLYDPSPTIKKQIQDSPTILQAKRKRSPVKQKGGFRLSIKSTTSYGEIKRANSTTTNVENLANNDKKRRTTMKTQLGQYDNFKNMTVVQQRKHRQFLARKKKLLSQINSGSGIQKQQPKRSKSPTSQALTYSINSIGEQQNVQKQDAIKSFQTPKVIFDQQKGVVIGKKPCARDGHIGLADQDEMIIIGGDRHMVSFNDCYIFKMDKAMKSVHRYL